jgi:hypothetical protein
MMTTTTVEEPLLGHTHKREYHNPRPDVKRENYVNGSKERKIIERTLNSDSDSTNPSSSGYNSPITSEEEELKYDIETSENELLFQGKEEEENWLANVPISFPGTTSLERHFSEMSCDLLEEQDDDDNTDDWEKVLEQLRDDKDEGDQTKFSSNKNAPRSIQQQIMKSNKTLSKKKKKTTMVTTAKDKTFLKKPKKVKPGTVFTEDERRERNRIAAANSRTKRKLRMGELEKEVNILKKTSCNERFKN